MPKIRRQNLPPALLHYLLDRIRSREISADQLGLFAEWLDTEPEVPDEKWFKRFPAMTVCGQGGLMKTFLTAQQLPCSSPMMPFEYMMFPQLARFKDVALLLLRIMIGAWEQPELFAAEMRAAFRSLR
jgi:hypothetical protein